MTNKATEKRLPLAYQLSEDTTLYKGFFKLKRFSVSHETFAGETLSGVQREVFLRGPAVGVLLVDAEREKVILVEQFRIGAAVAGATNPWLIELVAGIIEPGEEPYEVAVRESIEETGCRPHKVIPMYEYWVSPGGSDEVFHLFCGLTDSNKAKQIAGLDTEHEDIKVHVLDFNQAFSMLEEGKLNNAMTITGLQWLMLNKEKLFKS